MGTPRERCIRRRSCEQCAPDDGACQQGNGVSHCVPCGLRTPVQHAGSEEHHDAPRGARFRTDIVLPQGASTLRKRGCGRHPEKTAERPLRRGASPFVCRHDPRGGQADRHRASGKTRQIIVPFVGGIFRHGRKKASVRRYDAGPAMLPAAYAWGGFEGLPRVGCDEAVHRGAERRGGGRRDRALALYAQKSAACADKAGYGRTGGRFGGVRRTVPRARRVQSLPLCRAECGYARQSERIVPKETRVSRAGSLRGGAGARRRKRDGGCGNGGPVYHDHARGGGRSEAVLCKGDAFGGGGLRRGLRHAVPPGAAVT